VKEPKVSAPRVDARGRPCPWPIIELAKALRLHPEVELWADDPAVGADLESFCAATGARATDLQRDGLLLKAVVSR
jgi:tRNA 2-thiouridine synthesizing protein A